jgi:selenocysteine lyase/cysteine desulfurase
MAELHRKLIAARVHTSLRVDRQRQQYVRVSPHFYNSDGELQRLLDNLWPFYNSVTISPAPVVNSRR